MEKNLRSANTAVGLVSVGPPQLLLCEAEALQKFRTFKAAHYQPMHSSTGPESLHSL